MTRLSTWKKACGVVLLCAATVIAAPTQTFTPLVNFDRIDGATPYDSLIQGSDGNLYGTTIGGGLGDDRCYGGCGTVFRLVQDRALETVYSFCSQSNCPDGSGPAGLLQGIDGNLYGVTGGGGSPGCNCGTVYKLTPNGELLTLHAFDYDDGAYPNGPLIQGGDGSFYGTTFQGGEHGFGTVFKMTSDGTVTILYSFCHTRSCPDGAEPGAALVEGDDGNFYGTTTASAGGPCHNGCGTIFRVTPAGNLTVLYAFEELGFGGPSSQLLQDADGNFYGATIGSIYKLTSDGAVTTLYQFCVREPTCSAGGVPQGVIRGNDGNFYGTTAAGGPGLVGVLFELTPAGRLTTLHSFCSMPDCADGAAPGAPPFQATNGVLYGVAVRGGVPLYGTVFSRDVGLGPFVAFVRNSGKVGQTGGILGQGFTGTTSVSINGVSAAFTVRSDTYLNATVPPGATSGYVTVVTPSGTLTSNVRFRVLP